VSTIEGSITRKTFLKILGWIGLAGPFLLTSACSGGSGGDAGGSGADAQEVEVFKLSTRGRHACTACRNHAKYKLFETRTAADGNRAHPGCNCLIKPIRIPGSDAETFFARSPVYDSRRGTA
jgi:hypothetical protein